MRFEEEQSDPDNKGLSKAIVRLNKLQSKYPWMTHADIYVLAGYVAIETTGGPSIPFCYGRRDYSSDESKAVYSGNVCPFLNKDGNINPSKSRLPPADLGKCPYSKSNSNAKKEDIEKPTIDAVRATFKRLGMDDRETVVLIILGHQYGRCHPENSGYEFAWYQFGPTSYNIYEHGLGYMSLYENRAMKSFKEESNSSGKRQFNLHVGYDMEPFMMLPVDMVLHWDPKYREIVSQYNRNRVQFKPDASKAWKKLTELGCDRLFKEM
eukprot:Mrub_02844.p1 GENE.Mrub_02844~~Mrub_02844.p1  ORF type:complete len:266 (+),score=46.16 Mrub_02844:737-1534(+)